MGLRSESHESWQPVGQCPVIVLVLLICCDIYKYFPAIKFVLIMIDTFIGGGGRPVTLKSKWEFLMRMSQLTDGWA